MTSSSDAMKSREEMLQNILAGGTCTAFSVSTLHPLDTLRIKWQLLPNKQNTSMFQFGRTIISQQGLVRGLWIPGCLSHVCGVFFSSGVRLGCYPFVRDVLASGKEKDAFHMWLAGFLTGAVGFAAANPFFQAKVRLQAMPKHVPLISCLRTIYDEGGVRGLYRGSMVCMLRGALLNAGSQLGYDATKTMSLKYQIVQEDGPNLHLAASLVSAFGASAFCCPADYVLTKYQAAAMTKTPYRGVADCVWSIVKIEGPFAFYRGFMPLFGRLALLWSLNMPLYEQVRKLFGLSYLK